ncbi:AIPR family protein [Clostridium magnum]|uniref:AIPR protein n=1 Tax=Clostridium magnum DSM 2767 TaxID=1121326 RepID=A0A161X390_9CLOT|nr:AIPR family protein [Clostridium magnum]KZL93938.1 AIPR protein [Clostridium magnum DSM 2767]SHH98947.1 AIPR protein [Clostridium magnum DSM 2767]
MDMQDFRKDFLEDIKSTAATVGEGTVAAFVKVSTEYLISAEVLPDFIPSFFMGTGKSNRKFRIDGYVLDEFDYTMNLIIADYSGSEENRVVKRSQAIQIFDRLLHFVDEAYGNKLYKEIEISTPCADLVELLRTNRSRIRKYRLLLITDGYMSDRIDVLPSKNIDDVQVECQIWDIERLFKVCFSDMGRQNIEIDFKAYTRKGIPCLEASGATTDEYRSFLCIMPGHALADIYDYFGSQLLEGNVRSFLSTKVAVNKKIRETILKAPNMFFAFNNGVSATAMDLVIENFDDGKYITFAKDFQIINGGQTTASLSNARHKDKVNLESVFVQMKITEIDTDLDKSADLIRNISRSSNSQNKVSDADFFSTHPFHVRMEQISRRLFAPAVGGLQYDTRWFYERARGQYLQAQMRMTKSEKNKFVAQHPKKQLITKTDFAKVRNSWRGLPHIVSRGAQTNFMNFAEWVDTEWLNSDVGFNEKYFQESVALMILFKHTEYIVTHQAWYEQGYRANIVTYSIALLQELIKSQFPEKEVDLQIIWNRQSVPEAITNELINITKAVFETITDPKRETINVTQWCKRETCWTKVKDNKILLNAEIEKVLVDKIEIKSAEKNARKDQKMISGIEAQTKVLEYGSENWKNVMDFAIAKKLVTTDVIVALKLAIQMPIKLPNSHQSKKLIELLEQVNSEGYKIY